MSEVKVVTRKNLKKTIYQNESPKGAPVVGNGRDRSLRDNNSVIPGRESTKEIQIIAIGASTGGPLVLQTILSGLTPNFSIPVLIVQHIASGFIHNFVDWLAQTSAIPIHVPKNGEYIIPGHAYIAPDNLQMGVNKKQRISLSDSAPENNLNPSVSYLFRSVTENFGHKSIGILLTGMGRDGAMELKLMRNNGALTIVQDKESCVVFGMPKEAMELDAATYILTPEQIVQALKILVNPSPRPSPLKGEG